MSKKNEFDALERANLIVSERFAKVNGGASSFYDIRYRFKAPGERAEGQGANPQWGRSAYEAALLQRVAVVCSLTPEQRDADLAAVRPVVNALNDLAELIDHHFLDAPYVLSKYHLLLAREAFIVEPYVYYAVLFADRGRWGFRVLRLGAMARAYNDMNPVHRRPIYFLDGDRPDTDFGPLYLGPESRWIWLLKSYWAVRRRFGYPTITERSKRRQNRVLRSADDRMHHLRHTASRTASQPASRAPHDGPPVQPPTKVGQ